MNKLRTPIAAEYVGVAPNTLAIWRMNGTGPEFIKVGRSIYYLKEDLDSWMLSKKYRNTSEYSTKKEHS